MLNRAVIPRPAAPRGPPSIDSSISRLISSRRAARSAWTARQPHPDGALALGQRGAFKVHLWRRLAIWQREIVRAPEHRRESTLHHRQSDALTGASMHACVGMYK